MHEAESGELPFQRERLGLLTVMLERRERKMMMKRLRSACLFGLISIFFIAGIALAQGGGQGTAAQGATPKYGCQKRFQELDVNKDGKVTKEEFFAVPHHRENPELNFKAMDTNGDGALTKEEFCANKGRVRGPGANQ